MKTELREVCIKWARHSAPSGGYLPLVRGSVPPERVAFFVGGGTIRWVGGFHFGRDSAPSEGGFTGGASGITRLRAVLSEGPQRVAFLWEGHCTPVEDILGRGRCAPGEPWLSLGKGAGSGI